MNGAMGLKKFRFPVVVLLLAGALGGCSEADTLGDEPVDEVTITGTPTWANGVGTLMSLKCGVCHRVPAGSLSPASIPRDLDLNYPAAPGPGIRGANDVTVLVCLQGGILRQPTFGVRRMPLEYATPLTAGEMTALESWAQAGGP